GKLTKVYHLFSGYKKKANRIERANYFGLKTNLNDSENYYRKRHNPDQYISQMTYQYRNQIKDLHKEIKENVRQLKMYNNGYYIEEYKYDPAGNVVQEGNAWGTIDYQYNAANQLTKAGARTFEYDKNGNLIKDGYDGNYANYQYNYENRLIKASNSSKNNKLFGGEHPFKGTIEYNYDALNRKSKKKLTPANGSRVEISGYYYDGSGTDVLAEYTDKVWNMKQYQNSISNNNNSNIQGGHRKYLNEYYYGNGLAALNSMNNPNPWYMPQDVNFYHKDALGSVTAITGRNGNVVEEYKYGAYGSPYKGRFLNMQKNNPYGFTGQRYKAELRTYNFAYRAYNPVSMRWMTVDPARDGTNWYQYVNGDPVNLWDPLGLCDENNSFSPSFNTRGGLSS
ncbi:MAG: RHS repeat domain-containing protein, partial [bacterium]